MKGFLNKTINRVGYHNIILFVFFLFLVYWYRIFITSDPLPSSDLQFHIETMKKYKYLWYKGVFSFYDPTVFTGWPALQFYGFLPYLVTVIFSYLFDFLSENSIRLTTHTIIVVGTAALVFSVYFAAKPFCYDLFNDFSEEFLDRKNECFIYLAFSSCLFTFWFINSGYENYGVGLGAPLISGLYGQLFGWHALLFYIGTVTRYLKQDNNRNFVIFILAIAVNFLCHTLTAIFSICIGILCFVWYSDKRLKIVKSHFLGLSLIGFWLVPFLAYKNEYTLFSTIFYVFKGEDFFYIVFRYFIYDLFNTLTHFLKGNFILINPIYPIIIILFIITLLSQIIRKTKFLSIFFLFLLILFTLFSSEYFLYNIPVPLHFYRFHGLMFLLLAVLFSVVSLFWLKLKFKSNLVQRINSLLFFLIGIICILFTMFLPYQPLDTIKRGYQTIQAQYDKKEEILDAFLGSNYGSRVYFEYVKVVKTFPRLYFSSILNSKTGNESIVGVQMLQSSSYQYIFESLWRLNSKVYSPGSILRGEIVESINYESLINQLKFFGISHIVALSEEFKKSIEGFAINSPVNIEEFTIYQIQKVPFNNINKIEKNLVGYIDLNNNMPFKIVSMYFYSNDNLFNNFELIKLKDLNKINENIKILIINTSDNKTALRNKNSNKTYKIFTNYSSSPFLIDHYNYRRPKNNMVHYFKDVADYLDFEIDLPNLLRNHKFLPKRQQKIEKKPNLTWFNNNQAFRIENLIPGKVYRINYSYFPFWKTNNGELYRGLGERMYFIPYKDQADFRYTRLYSIPTWIGLFATVLTLSYFYFFIYRENRNYY